MISTTPGSDSTRVPHLVGNLRSLRPQRQVSCEQIEELANLTIAKCGCNLLCLLIPGTHHFSLGCSAHSHVCRRWHADTKRTETTSTAFVKPSWALATALDSGKGHQRARQPPRCSDQYLDEMYVQPPACKVPGCSRLPHRVWSFTCM